MQLKSLLNVLDNDTKINISSPTRAKEIFDGSVLELDITEFNEDIVKVVWYSPIYNRLMIEI